MLKTIRFLYDFFCKIISPPYCAHCKKLIDERVVFCSGCFDLITPIVSHRLAITKTKNMTVYALSAYKNPLRGLILQKNRQNPLAAAQLGSLLANHLGVDSLKIDCFVPVPLHWTRYAYRGFNQAEVMARPLSKRFKVPVVPLVKRSKKTPFQSLFSSSGRFENVKDAFWLDEKYSKMFAGKNIVIVDDVMTSGATLQTIARKLLKLKPQSISAIVCCRVT